jgi:hypothetical protein
MIEAEFYKAITQAFGMMIASPLRIMAPRIEANKGGFVIYSGFINYPSPMRKII